MKNMEERRKETRSSRIKAAQIIFNNKHSVIDCRMTDVSGQGARLSLVNTLGVPDEFIVKLPNLETQLWARRAWSKYGEMGVEFI
jgi:hypothetical protein